MSASWIILLGTVALSVIAFNNVSYYEKWIFKPYEVARGRRLSTLFSSGLIHADWIHLAVNMFTFFNFSFALEATVGTTNFLIIYFGSMVTCEIGTIMKHKNNVYFRSLGASGAVCGMLFSYILFAPMSKLYFFPIPIPIPAFIMGFIYLGYTIYASKRNHDYINHDAHLWGSVAGIILTIMLVPESIDFFLNSF